MQAHQNTMEHGKQTLELKQDLAKKQVDAYLAHANMTEYEVCRYVVDCSIISIYLFTGKCLK